MRSQSGSTMSSIDPLEWVGYETPFGRGWVGTSPAGRIEDMRLPGTGTSGPPASSPVPAAARLAERLAAYFAGGGPLPDGSEFVETGAATPLDRAIYRVVTRIPCGATMTYGEVAAALGRPKAARAVGAAMARNRFAPAIPCHRVVGSDGSLRGYAGGKQLKRRLLEMERANA